VLGESPLSATVCKSSSVQIARPRLMGTLRCSPSSPASWPESSGGLVRARSRDASASKRELLGERLARLVGEDVLSVAGA
jgi:hypothetical protein